MHLNKPKYGLEIPEIVFKISECLRKLNSFCAAKLAKTNDRVLSVNRIIMIMIMGLVDVERAQCLPLFYVHDWSSWPFLLKIHTTTAATSRNSALKRKHVLQSASTRYHGGTRHN